MYADIIIDITHEKLDRVFQYRIPSDLEGILEVGAEVVVPFGRGNQKRNGYIIGFSKETNYDKGKIKFIDSICKKKRSIEGNLIALASWMRETYGGTLIQSLRTVLPVKKEIGYVVETELHALWKEEELRKQAENFGKKKQVARERVLHLFLEEAHWKEGELRKKAKVSSGVIDYLVKKGILERKKVEERGSWEEESFFRSPCLSPEQSNIVEAFRQDLFRGRRQTYLLFGVTGSGKTEVYLSMIEEVIERGEQVIVLIPEIALTYQTMLRFRQRFGNRVAILHSRMSQGERNYQMERVEKGEVSIMVGPRSALFTPFSKLGLIVMDEEHEATYKSEQTPRYHGREVAEKRANMEGASLVLGSATPSIESFHRVQTGEITGFFLRERIGKKKLPKVHLIDMGEEFREGNRSMFSRRLKEAIQNRLERREQTMIFLNRRGYAGFLSCRCCGFVPKCTHCDVSLSLHQGKKLVCHYCGFQRPSLEVCPKCQSPYLGGFRMGTQQVEEWIKREFPEARVLRMDMDSTRRKDGHQKILEPFQRGEADILLGTQMIVKGHDYPNVTLVGILAADLSLHAQDYMASERTFQLLVQAAGRAGRGDREGEVFVQTYQPEHYSIVLSGQQDYLAFYEKEMYYRKWLEYPPKKQLLGILVSGKEEALVQTAVFYLKQLIERVEQTENLKVIGPATPLVGKVQDVYRRVLYIKGEKREDFSRTKQYIEAYIQMNEGFRNLKVQFDWNPIKGW